MRVLVIEKAAVKQNIRVVKRRAGGAAVYGVLSGDAGGAGIAEMAELLRAEGIGRFAVSEAEEDSRDVRKSLSTRPKPAV